MSSIIKPKHHKGYLWIYKHRIVSYNVEILLKHLCNKGLANGLKPIDALRIQKHVSSVRIFLKSDKDESNPYGNQAMHFVG